MSTQPRRALVVIDAQNEYFTGHLPIEYPDPQTSIVNIGRAMDAAREAGIPVIVVQNYAPPGAAAFVRDSDGWQLHPVVAARPRDRYLEKSLPSAFAGTDLAGWLEANAIDTLAVSGYMTHNCDDSTVKQAVHLGLSVEFLHDASGALAYENDAGRASAEEIHRVFTVVMQSRFAAVLSTQAWIEAVATGVPPMRDTIVGSNRRARGLSPTAA